MRAIDPTKTIRELALYDRRIRIALGKLGLDVCCGGGKTVADAADDAGLTLQAISSAIDQALRSEPATAATRQDWTTASPAELVEHIVTKHHAFLHEALPRIDDMLRRVIAAHGASHGNVLLPLRATFTGLRAELEAHLAQEEEIIFPYIRELSAVMEHGGDLPPIHIDNVTHPIRQLMLEHEHAGEALRDMRKLTDDFALPEDACATYTALFELLETLEADLHEHVFLENNVLFPQAEALEMNLKRA